MATKKTEAVEEKVEKVELQEITTDFGRADLNELRDAVNALIRR